MLQCLPSVFMFAFHYRLLLSKYPVMTLHSSFLLMVGRGESVHISRSLFGDTPSNTKVGSGLFNKVMQI